MGGDDERRRVGGDLAEWRVDEAERGVVGVVQLVGRTLLLLQQVGVLEVLLLKMLLMVARMLFTVVLGVVAGVVVAAGV